VTVEEDGRMIEDACYHCGNTGVISEDEAQADRVTALCERIAGEIVHARQERDKQDEEYGLAAAENCCMSIHDWYRCMAWGEAERVHEELERLAPATVARLVGLLDGPIELTAADLAGLNVEVAQAVKKAAAPRPEPVVAAPVVAPYKVERPVYNGDDIPF
jgi:hypothetical protein